MNAKQRIVTFVPVKSINRTVWILSVISLFADVASEMLYPIIPVYLQKIGFSVFLMGTLEGVANFTSGISKGYFGKRSDETGLRLPFIKWGYFLSALSKPMVGVFTWPLWIFLARTTDRLGKGIRTAARDALLSQNATPETKGKVFGFHRSFDTLGATIGPIAALVFLSFYPEQYATLFYLAFLPGLLSVALVFLVKEKRTIAPSKTEEGFFSFFNYWNIAGAEYKQLVSGLLLFALFNSADVFLLLKTKDVTGSDSLTLSAYIFYNLVFAVASFPLGTLADKFGFKSIFVTGLLFFIVVYVLFGISTSAVYLFSAFFLYGLYAAATEGVVKAWITNIVQPSHTATAIGFYTSCESICTLLASAIAGFLWSTFNSRVTFFTTAVAALAALFYLLIFLKKGVKK
ncbi:MAG: MFS transporter [Flavisolibacter sp.]|nr:MFS transporter [Flavisolibacter sp.]